MPDNGPSVPPPRTLFDWPTIEHWALGGAVPLDRLMVELRDALDYYTAHVADSNSTRAPR